MTAEVSGAPPVGGMGGDIRLHQLGEGRVADIAVEHLVVLGEHLGEAGDIGVTIDAEQRLALFS
jgi:hypothetical protein